MNKRGISDERIRIDQRRIRWRGRHVGRVERIRNMIREGGGWREAKGDDEEIEGMAD